MYKRTLRLIILALVILFGNACSHPSADLERAEQLVETHPDSAQQILRKLTPTRSTSDVNRALYGLTATRVKDRLVHHLLVDSLLDFPIDYYQRHSDPQRLAMCYLYKGRSYKYNFQYEKAMHCYLKSTDLLVNRSDYLTLARVTNDMGDIHLTQRDYKLAREKYSAAYTYFKKSHTPTFALYSLIYMGLTYAYAKQYKKAQPYFAEAYKQTTDSITRGAVMQEIGINYYNEKRYDSAMYYLCQVIRYPYIKNNLAIRYYYLADLYFDTGKIDSAFNCATKSFRYDPDIRTQRECYRILTNCEYIRKHLKSMSYNMGRYVDINDSLRKIDAQTKGSFLSKMHETDINAEKTGSQRWWLMGVLLVLVIATLILYIRMRKRNRLERERNETLLLQQKNGIRKELVHKHRDALLHKIETIKAEQMASRKKATVAEKEELDRRLYEELLHLNNVDFFYREMDAVLNNLVGKLKSRYPALTSKEITWCCLHLLQVPASDVLLLLNYKVDSLNKMKQRLAQKVGLNSVTELDNFLNSLLTE